MQPKRKAVTFEDDSEDDEVEMDDEVESYEENNGESGDEDEAKENDDSEEDDDDGDDNADGDMFPQEEPLEESENGLSRFPPPEDEEDGELEPSSKRRRVITKSMTSEEAFALSSAETSLNANLFKFQTQEMLKEIRLPDEIVSKKIAPFVKRIETILQVSPAAIAAAATPVKMLQHLEQVDGVKIPFAPLVFSAFQSQAMGGSFQFAIPASVGLSGCFPLGLVCQPKILIDVAVEMPAASFQKKDVSHFRYAFKRAAYLAHVAAILKKEAKELSKSGVEMKFTREAEDPLRVRLTLTPKWPFLAAEKDLEIVFSLFCFAGENPHLTADKLTFEKSLVDESWFYESVPEKILFGDESKPALRYAAHYENDLLRDLTHRRHQAFLEESVFKNSQSLREGVALLHTWLRQRGLAGEKGLNNDTLAIIVAYLLVGKKMLTKELGAVQVFRKMLVAFANGVFETGASLCGSGQGEVVANRRQRLETFFDVVVLDRTGSCNLTPTLTKLTLSRVSREARAALACLDDPHSQDAFDELFLHPIPPLMQFDQIFVIQDKDGKAFERLVEEKVRFFLALFQDIH